MTPGRARQLIAQGEGQKVEFKSSTAETRGVIETLSAFAHSQGGTVFIGVSDKGNIVGAGLGTNTQENLANDIRRNTQPPQTLPIDDLLLDGRHVLAIRISRLPADQLLYAYDQAFVRVGKSNQRMSPDEVRQRMFRGFKAENLRTPSSRKQTESWLERERRRLAIYEQNRGLFLAHEWRPSTEPGQVADIVIYVRQHGEGPLTEGTAKSVEYHLGRKFFNRTVVKTNVDESFRLEVSAYGPMLCLACVHFDDGSPSIDLDRYIDF